MSFAPILVTVYNRYQHFINCIESLKKNIQSKDSHLFISIDAPSKEEDVKINKSIINYSKSIGGFKDITILVREKNYGSFLNRHHARNEIFNIYSEIIEFEDDNIFSIDFLVYHTLINSFFNNIFCNT